MGIRPCIGRADLGVISEYTGSAENVLGNKAGAWTQVSVGILGVILL